AGEAAVVHEERFEVEAGGLCNGFDFGVQRLQAVALVVHGDDDGDHGRPQPPAWASLRSTHPTTRRSHPQRNPLRRGLPPFYSDADRAASTASPRRRPPPRSTAAAAAAPPPRPAAGPAPAPG